jgi:hypothetical protein
MAALAFSSITLYRISDSDYAAYCNEAVAVGGELTVTVGSQQYADCTEMDGDAYYYVSLGMMVVVALSIIYHFLVLVAWCCREPKPAGSPVDNY